MTNKDFFDLILDALACRMTVGQQLMNAAINADEDMAAHDKAKALKSEEQVLESCKKAVVYLAGLSGALDALEESTGYTLQDFAPDNQRDKGMVA